MARPERARSGESVHESAVRTAHEDRIDIPSARPDRILLFDASRGVAEAQTTYHLDDLEMVNNEAAPVEAAASGLVAILNYAGYLGLNSLVQSYELKMLGYTWLMLMPFVAGSVARFGVDALKLLPLPQFVKKLAPFVVHAGVLAAIHYQLYSGLMLQIAVEGLIGVTLSPFAMLLVSAAIYGAGYYFRPAFQAFNRTVARLLTKS